MLQLIIDIWNELPQKSSGGVMPSTNIYIYAVMDGLLRIVIANKAELTDYLKQDEQIISKIKENYKGGPNQWRRVAIEMV